jgi:DNA (cytosine-5)-methyltransferase 1
LTKADYKIPLMAEIKSLPWNGYKVASTFSGGGGSCLGYRMAGYKVVYANEFVPAAQETYKANHPDSFLDTRDIRTVQASDILDAINLKPGELDIFDGSPPCSAFSTAGSREAGWGKSKKYSDNQVQRVDDLFFEYSRILNGLQPKVFIAENVSGLIKGTAKGYFKKILAELKNCGYQVSCKLLDSQWLGVPQARQRTIFVGVRNDLNVLPSHPKPFEHPYKVEESFHDIATPKIIELRTLGETTSTLNLWHHTKAGDNFSVANLKLRGKASCFNQIKISPFKPAPTITATAQAFHWSEPRYLTIPEVRRLCSFPDDFILEGNFMQQWERMGRSVPPLMMKAISAHVAKEILSCVA